MMILGVLVFLAGLLLLYASITGNSVGDLFRGAAQGNLPSAP